MFPAYLLVILAAYQPVLMFVVNRQRQQRNAEEARKLEESKRCRNCGEIRRKVTEVVHSRLFIKEPLSLQKSQQPASSNSSSDNVQDTSDISSSDIQTTSP